MTNKSGTPHQGGKEQYQRHITGGINVHGEVEARFPSNLIEKHDAERREDSARDKKKFWIEVLTLVALVITAAIATWQGMMSRELMQSTTQQFQKEQRPYVWVSIIKPYPFFPSEKLRADIHFVNYGKTPALKYHGVAIIFVGEDSVKRAYEWFDTLGDKPLPQTTISQAVIAPGVPVDPEKSPAFTTVFSTDVLSAEEAVNLANKDFQAVIAAREEYADMAGNWYRSDVCNVRLKTGALADCDKHNELK